MKLTIPMHVHAKDQSGQPFQTDARTIILSRYGALIRVPRPLRFGQVVELVNAIASHRRASFRVVGPVSVPTDKGNEWAVEYVNPKENIWGVSFPAPAEGTEDVPKALLECQACHTVAMSRISFEEADVLETSGILSRLCDNCARTTLTSYAVQALSLPGPSWREEDQVPPPPAKSREERESRRVSLEIPVLIRDYYGGAEITKTANASKGGFCFASEKMYLVGQGLVVVSPYRENSEEIGVQARIVWRKEVEAMHRRFYGVRLEPKH